jgi:hypothetical protein
LIIFVFRWHSITLIPPLSLNGPPRLLCLQHYMAASSGWDYVSRCNVCRELYRDGIRPLAGSVATYDPCSCDYRRQPPPLRDLALRTVHTFVLNVDRFELTRDVTLPQYLFRQFIPCRYVATASSRISLNHCRLTFRMLRNAQI